MCDSTIIEWFWWGFQLWSAIVFGVFLLWLAFILIEYIMN